MEKRITFRCDNNDITNIDSIKAIINSSKDSDAIRYALRKSCQTLSDKPDIVPITKPLPVKVRKFEDKECSRIFALDGFPKERCPRHPDLPIYGCRCWGKWHIDAIGVRVNEERTELYNWMKEQYVLTS